MRTVCLFCGDPISQQRVWPSGAVKWVAPHPVFTTWSFCPAVDGGDHEPATDADSTFLEQIGATL